MNYKSIVLILIIVSYHFFIINHLEKMFFGRCLPWVIIHRPSIKCKTRFTKPCLGFPSGHTEAVALATLLLYHYGWTPLWFATVSIVVTGFQRFITRKHTPLQIVAGGMFGLFYYSLYLPFVKHSWLVSLLFMSMIGLFWFLFCELLFSHTNIQKNGYKNSVNPFPLSQSI